MRYSLSFFIAIFSLSGFSQQGNAIVLGEAQWSTLEVHCLPAGNNYTTYHIKFEGDTIIEGQACKIIWRSDDDSQSVWNFYGAIRENEQHEVFLRPPFYLEGKIYDFGASVGDTVQATNYFLGSGVLNFIVTDIDSVLLLDRYRKRITVFEPDLLTEEIWIEGLGSLYGLLHSSNPGYGTSCGISESLCFEEDGIQVYQHPLYNDCHVYSLVNTESLNESGIQIFPNPATSRFMIDLGNNASYQALNEVKIYSIDGKMVYALAFQDNKKEISLQSLKRGIYLIKLTSGQTDYPTVKLVVE